MFKLHQTLNILIFGFLLLVVLAQCSRVEVAGNTSETTNSISGVVTDVDENPVSNARITLYPHDYNPMDSGSFTDLRAVVSDSEGYYHLEDVEKGGYNLQIENSSLKAVIPNLNFDVEITSFEINPVLKKTASLSWFAKQFSEKENGAIYIPGTHIFSVVDRPDFDSGLIVFEGIPEGTYSEIKFNPSSENSGIRVLQDTLKIGEGDSLVVYRDSTSEGIKEVVIAPPTPHTRKITWNTSDSIISLTEPLINFPLLLRLTSENFDGFDSIQNSSDIWVTKEDGALLPVNIERWDATNQRAEIWVSVDSILPNQRNTILMHWSDFRSPDINRHLVFDNAYGYVGVWHLGEQSDDVIDQSQNNNNGTFLGDIPSVTEGTIAGAQKLDGVGDFIKIPHHASLDVDEYTFSAWVKSNDDYGRIFDKTLSEFADGYLFQIHEQKLNICMDSVVCLYSDSIPLEEYMHVAVTHSESQVKFYLNGLKINEIDTALTVYLNSYDLRIGAEQNEGEHAGTFFNGIIDEARISNVVRSEEWMNFSFQNQRIESTIIMIE